MGGMRRLRQAAGEGAPPGGGGGGGGGRWGLGDGGVVCLEFIRPGFRQGLISGQ